MRSVVLVGIAYVLFLPAPFARAQDDKPAVTKEQPQEIEAWRGFYHTKINWRYHISQAVRWAFWDNVTRAATIAFAFLSCLGTLLTTKSKRWRIVWIAAALISFIVSMVPFVLPFGAWTTEHTLLASRWNQLGDKWYDMYQASKGRPDTQQVADQLSKLRKTTTDLENSEPTARYSEKVMAAAEAAEDAFQGINKPPDVGADVKSS